MGRIQKNIHCHPFHRRLLPLVAWATAFTTILTLFPACQGQKAVFSLSLQEPPPVVLKHGGIATATVTFDKDIIWTLHSMKTKKVRYRKGQSKVTLRFNPESSIISGNTSCNNFSTNYIDKGNGILFIDDIITTKVACPEDYMALERSYLSLLAKVNGYLLGEYELQLLQDGKPILSFSREE